MEQADRVLAHAHARLAIDERVVERVGERDEGGHPEHTRFSAAVAAHRRSVRSKNPITRRSYSRGRASWPPTCLDSGISQRALGWPAAL
jgi:hypothetical protein